MPTTPPPITTSRFGISVSSRIAVESMVCSTPLIGMREGKEPVAMMTSAAWISWLPALTRPLPSSVAVALIDSMPAALKRVPTPFTKVLTTFAFRACAGALLGRPGLRSQPIGGVAVRERHPAIAAEGSRSDLDAGRRLAPLVLGAVDEVDDARHRMRVVPGRHQLFIAAVVLDVAAEDGIQLLVRRQRIAVLLLLAQLSRGGLGQHALRDHLRRQRISVPAELIDLGLGDVLQHRETARHVAVQRAVPRGQLGLVSSAEHQPAEFVGEAHQDVTPDAGLDILLGDSRLGAVVGLLEHLLEGSVGRVDRDLEELDAEVLGDRSGVLQVLL